LDHAPAVPRL